LTARPGAFCCTFASCTKDLLRDAGVVECFCFDRPLVRKVLPMNLVPISWAIVFILALRALQHARKHTAP